MVAPLDAATRQSVIDQATALAAQQGISPEQALYNYAQANGLSASDVDTYMGFPAGATQNWAVGAGQAPAPQGNHNVVQPAPQGNSYNPGAAAAVPAKFNLPAGYSGSMESGEGPLTSQPLAYKAGAGGDSPYGSAASAAPAANLGLGGGAPAPAAQPSAPTPVPAGVQPLSAADRQSVIDQATALAKAQGITPQRALYDYAAANKIGVQDVDKYMGWDVGTTANWAKTNVPGFAPPTTTVAPAKVPTALDAATRASVIEQAKAAAAKVPGMTPEQALYQYAQTQGINNGGIDTYMGFNPGTTDWWANNAIKPVAPAAVPAPSGPLTTTNDYKMPVLNALYQNQQQRMTSEAPKFNFQAQTPAAPTQQPGALTNVISAP